MEVIEVDAGGLRVVDAERVVPLAVGHALVLRGLAVVDVEARHGVQDGAVRAAVRDDLRVLAADPRVDGIAGVALELRGLVEAELLELETLGVVDLLGVVRGRHLSDIYIYIYIYIHTYIDRYIYIYVLHAYVYMYIYIYMYMYTDTFVYICLSLGTSALRQVTGMHSSFPPYVLSGRHCFLYVVSPP